MTDNAAHTHTHTRFTCLLTERIAGNVDHHQSSSCVCLLSFSLALRPSTQLSMASSAASAKPVIIQVDICHDDGDLQPGPYRSCRRESLARSPQVVRAEVCIMVILCFPRTTACQCSSGRRTLVGLESACRIAWLCWQQLRRLTGLQAHGRRVHRVRARLLVQEVSRECNEFEVRSSNIDSESITGLVRNIMTRIPRA